MSRAPALSVAAALAAAAALGFAAGRGGRYPSYAPVFDAVADGVVNVTVEGDAVRLGSGFAISADEVVTARHLVVEGGDVVVRDRAGRSWPASVVGTDARADLALLSVPGAGFDPETIGSTDELRVGDPVVAIGNPYGLGHSLSVGVVAAPARRVNGAAKVEFLQMSIPLYPGGSGGPLFDEDGDVVGVLSGTHAQGQAIAFVVPAEALAASLPALRAGQRVSRAFIGFALEDGVARRVIPSAPAERAGIRDGDRVLAVDGRPLGDLTEILDAIGPGKTVPVEVERAGARLRIDVTLSDWAEQPIVIAGLILRPAPGTGGRVAALTPGSRGERAGVLAGDVVRAVDGVPVRAPSDVRDALLGGAAAQLEVVRGGVSVVLPFEGR